MAACRSSRSSTTGSARRSRTPTVRRSSPIESSRCCRAVQPEVVHVHNLLNLSFDLPALAHAHGSAVVATLHDHSLVCPSGGQRLHRADEHLCDVIDTDRCARCFRDSPFHAQISFGEAVARSPGRLDAMHRAAAAGLRRFPMLGHRVARTVRSTAAIETTRAQIDERLLAARRRVRRSRSLRRAVAVDVVGVSAARHRRRRRSRSSDYGFAPSRQTHEWPRHRGTAAPNRLRRHARLAQGRACPDRCGPRLPTEGLRAEDLRQPRHVFQRTPRACGRNREACPFSSWARSIASTSTMSTRRSTCWSCRRCGSRIRRW